LPVAYTSSNPAVATVSGSTVTVVGPGTTTIMADQAGNTNFYGAPTVSQPLTVNATQTMPASNDAPLASPLGIALFSLLLFVTGSLQLRKSTRPRT